MHTVFVVDDDPAIREVFSAFLELGGCSVMEAGGGRECLEQLKTRTPDLILLDMMMEPMDGWETLRAIRSQPEFRQIPVIIITGKHPVPADIARYGGQIEDFIVKPVEFQKTVASLHTIIENAGDLERVTAQKKNEGQDPVLVDEYLRLLRSVRITRHLMKRFGGLAWEDEQGSLQKQEAQLIGLHSRLGYPDRFMERCHG